MDFTPETKLGDILDAYPWLTEELPKMDERLEILNSRLARSLIRRADIAEAAHRADCSPETLIEKLQELIAEHGAD